MESNTQKECSTISVVIPVYNEAEKLIDNITVINQHLSQYSSEIILVNDGSSDQSVEKINQLCEQHPHIKKVLFSRNFGKEAAIHAGLQAATGAAIIVMDADLQHPPSLLEPMIKAWQQGELVVEAVKSFRNDATWLDRVLAKGFYRLYQTFSGLDIAGHSDFKLLDRKVLDTYLSLPEQHRFFRGIVHWLGFESQKIEFSVMDRSGGGSSWTRLRLAKYAINNITSFSTSPLQIITALGLLSIVFGFIMAALTLFQKASGVSVDGFTTVNLLIITIGGAIMTSLGIIGHYLGKIYEEIKARPLYVTQSPKLENIKPESSEDNRTG